MPHPKLQRGLVVVGVLFSGAASAQPVDAAREFDAMRQRMNPRITEKPPAVGQAPAVEAPKRSGWAKLAVGLGEDQVTELLGAPDRIERRPRASRWHWEKGAEKGWVDFAGDPRKVTEWRSR